MGMAGHAEFVSTDMSVFAHVHPAGSVSMSAMELARTGPTGASEEFQTGMPTYMAMAMPMSRAPLPPEVSFPHGFPRPGADRIFVQTNRGGRVETGRLDAPVRR